MEYHSVYAKQVYDELRENNIRCEVDLRDEKMNYKLRESIIKKYPITLILGDKEKDNENISFRRYGSEETITTSKEDFIKLILNEINSKKVL
jgi:threonyl-tRNA synthetase